MKKVFLLLGLAVLFTGCTTVQPRQQVQAINSMDGFTVVQFKDGRYFRFITGDSLVISDKNPQGVLKKDVYGEIKTIPLEFCRCDKKQIVDCYISNEEYKQKLISQLHY